MPAQTARAWAIRTCSAVRIDRSRRRAERDAVAAGERGEARAVRGHVAVRPVAVGLAAPRRVQLVVVRARQALAVADHVAELDAVPAASATPSARAKQPSAVGSRGSRRRSSRRARSRSPSSSARPCGGTSSSAGRAGRSSRPCRRRSARRRPGARGARSRARLRRTSNRRRRRSRSPCSARRSRAAGRAATSRSRSGASHTPPSPRGAWRRTRSASRRSAAWAARVRRRAARSAARAARAHRSYPSSWRRRTVVLVTFPASTSDATPTPLPHVITAATNTPPGQ